MPAIEDDLKVQNWLSILTYDVVKYVAAGGVVIIEWTDDGLTMRLPDVAADDVHSKFLRLTEASAAPAEATP